MEWYFWGVSHYYNNVDCCRACEWKYKSRNYSPDFSPNDSNWIGPIIIYSRLQDRLYFAAKITKGEVAPEVLNELNHSLRIWLMMSSLMSSCWMTFGDNSGTTEVQCFSLPDGSFTLMYPCKVKYLFHVCRWFENLLCFLKFL